MFQITLIFLSFALIHSITVTRRFKELCRRLCGDAFMRVWYRFLYNAVSTVTVVIAFRMMRLVPDQLLWTAPALLLWPMRAGQAAAVLFGALSFRYLDVMEFLGIRQVGRFLAKREAAGDIEGLTQGDLITKGVYGIVRHPMYLAGIAVVTLNPHMTVNGLTFTVLADLYFLFGMFIEERRFVTIFGARYREYMLQVPRMVPGLGGLRGK